MTSHFGSYFHSERRKKASGWEKNLLYPIVMLILLAGTVSAVTDSSLSPNCLLLAYAAGPLAIGTNTPVPQILLTALSPAGETTFVQ